MAGFPFANLNQTATVYCFLDLEHPAVAWAVMRGMMVSADYASTPPNPAFVSFMQAGMIESLNNRRLYNEFLIERVRERSFGHHISRIRGMYFFSSRQQAASLIGDPEWPPYFEPQNLLELRLHHERPLSVMDANWITFAPLHENGHLDDKDGLKWIEHYWHGKTYNNSPVWETLAIGVALVLDEQVRRRCFEYVKEMFPKAHIPILMARLASEAGTRGGLVSPFLLREDDQRARLTYLWSDAEFHDPLVIEAIRQHRDAGHLGHMMAQNETWNAPDFRPWGRVFQVGMQVAPEQLVQVRIPSLHHPE